MTSKTVMQTNTLTVITMHSAEQGRIELVEPQMKSATGPPDCRARSQLVQHVWQGRASHHSPGSGQYLDTGRGKVKGEARGWRPQARLRLHRVKYPVKYRAGEPRQPPKPRARHHRSQESAAA